MVISMPARAAGSIDLQCRVINRQRVEYVFIAGVAYAITDQLKKSSTNDFMSRVAPSRPAWQIVDLHIALIGILDAGFRFLVDRADTYVIFGAGIKKRT